VALRLARALVPAPAARAVLQPELELAAFPAALAPRSAVLAQAAPRKAPRVDQRWLET
jgi:hypothetical protein